MCQDTRSGGLNDLLASAEIGHDALVDLSRKEAFEAPDERWTPSFGQVFVTAKVESGFMIQAALG
jgi:hypothetical protein